MSNTDNLSRRGFVAVQAAAVAATGLGVGGATQAATQSATQPIAQPAAMDWPTVTAEGFGALVGDRFQLKTEAGKTAVMRLVEVEPIHSGPARPDLPRKEGLVAIFASEGADDQELVTAGHQLHRVSHWRLGAADLHMGPSPRRGGGHYFELVLN